MPLCQFPDTAEDTAHQDYRVSPWKPDVVDDEEKGGE
jgi:hypothetical protein